MKIPQPPYLLTRHASVALLSLILLVDIAPALAGQGHSHGDSAFEGQGNQPSGKVEVDEKVGRSLGIKVDRVSQKPLAVSIKTSGQIENLPSKQVEVSTPIDQAKVAELLVEPGQVVKLGQPVAVLSSPGLVELRVNSLTQKADAEAAFQQAQADLMLAQQNYQRFSEIAAKEVAQAQSKLKFAQEKYDRDKELADRGVIPTRDALESETQLAEAKTQISTANSKKEVIAAENQVKRARADVKAAQSRLNLSDTQYRTRLQQLGNQANERGLITVTAPISGRVADREATLGQAFQDAGGKLMTIIDDSSVFATGNIYEKDLPKVRRGQQVRVKISGIPDRTFTGTVAVVGSVVEGQRRIIPVKAKLNNPKGELKPGMFANLEVLTDRSTAATLAVPSEAVVEANGKNLVFVQEGSAYEPVEVTLGESSGGLVEIQEGLKPGDRAVTQGGILLYAQSLKASGQAPPSEEEHGHEEGKEAAKSTEAQGSHSESEEHAHEEGKEAVAANSSEQSSLPGWLLPLLGGSAIAAGAFWIGRSSKIAERSTKANFDYEHNLGNGNGSSHQSQPSSSEDRKRRESEIEHR
jgi:cobalt-zinc-cadmium efflux system membrane fusion protein